MLNLSYAACYDPYHTLLRMICILLKAPGNALPIETLRIGDFFMCFPMRLEEFRPAMAVSGMRRRTNAVIREEGDLRFEMLPKSDVLFERMEIIQGTAISAMKARGIADLNRASAASTVKLNEDFLSTTLRQEAHQYIERHANLIHLVAEDFASIPPLGRDGLKHRSGLGEWLYDSA